jgi:hypothetical protein
MAYSNAKGRTLLNVLQIGSINPHDKDDREREVPWPDMRILDMEISYTQGGGY